MESERVRLKREGQELQQMNRDLQSELRNLKDALDPLKQQISKVTNDRRNARRANEEKEVRASLSLFSLSASGCSTERGQECPQHDNKKQPKTNKTKTKTDNRRSSARPPSCKTGR